MTEVRRIGRAKVAAIATIAGSAFISYLALWTRVLRARQNGLGARASLEQAVGFIGQMWPAFLLVGIGAGLTAYLLASVPARGRERIAPQAARIAGAQRWRRWLVLLTVLVLLSAALSALLLLRRILSGYSPRPEDWRLLCYHALAVIAVLFYWLLRPSREMLYALGSGDRSQVNDERVQDIKGRAAASAVNAFVALLLLVGLPYEVLVRGVWPMRSVVEAGALLFLWSIFAWRWNRKL